MKNINQQKHTDLLQAELDYQTFEFEKLLNKQAAKMFVDRQLYICRYQGYDEARGNIILRFDTSICPAPRKNENLLCFVSKFQDNNVRQWGGATYKDLREGFLSQFEAKTVFF
jgi:DNA replication ATP-dependent helicase Dna2